MDDLQTSALLSDFPEQLSRKDADVPNTYFTFFDAAGIPPNLVLNQNAKTKGRRIWVRFKISASEAVKNVHTIWCCLWSMQNLVKTSRLPTSKLRFFCFQNLPIQSLVSALVIS